MQQPKIQQHELCHIARTHGSLRDNAVAYAFGMKSLPHTHGHCITRPPAACLNMRFLSDDKCANATSVYASRTCHLQAHFLRHSDGLVFVTATFAARLLNHTTGATVSLSEHSCSAVRRSQGKRLKRLTFSILPKNTHRTHINVSHWRSNARVSISVRRRNQNRKLLSSCFWV